MNKAILTLIILLTAGSLGAQTIHKDDMKYFYAAFALDSSVDHWNKPIFINSILEWHLIYPDANWQVNYDSVVGDNEQRHNKHWVSFNRRIKKQSGTVSRVDFYVTGSTIKYNRQFYMLHDLHGYESRRNVMTIWDEIGYDSLKLNCASVGPFEIRDGITQIEYITLLQDSSYLLIIKNEGRDEGHWWGNYKFLVETESCKFEQFYKKSWGFNESDLKLLNLYYIYDQMEGNSYKLTEIKEFYHYMRDFEFGYLNEKVHDTNIVKVLDLKQMAEDYLKGENK